MSNRRGIRGKSGRQRGDKREREDKRLPRQEIESVCVGFVFFEGGA